MVAFGTFSPFTLLTLMIDPYDYASSVFTGPDINIMQTRLVAVVVCLVAIGAYALGVWSMYKSMVKNFDMTIRRQSR